MSIASLKVVPGKTEIQIPAPNMRTATFRLIGTAPYVQNRFAAKAELMAKHAAGDQGKSKRKKSPKDFDLLYRNAMHVSTEGWVGIPAPAFRAGAISACRLVKFAMTLAKLSIFVVPDGLDKNDGTPLVRIEGEPEMVTHHTRNETGVVDIRARPMWQKWGCTLNVEYDADQFSESDICNLLNRVGCQVGIGEGRPDSKKSAGMGWGTFKLA